MKLSGTEIEDVATANCDLDLLPFILQDGGALDVDRAPDCWERRAHISRYLFARQVFRGSRLLDFGCGVGFGSEMLSTGGNRVFALDTSVEALYHAVERRGLRENLNFWHASVLPSLDPFDGCTAFEVIEHLVDPEAFLATVKARHLVASVPIVPTLATNPHHKHDFTEPRFLELVGKYFDIRWLWRQTRPYFPDPSYLIFHAERKA